MFILTRNKRKSRKKDGALHEVLRTIQIQRLSFHLLHGPYILKCCVTSCCRSQKEGRDKRATTWAGTVCTVNSTVFIHDFILETLFKVEDLQTWSMGLNLSVSVSWVYVQKLKETFRTLLLCFYSEDPGKFNATSAE